MVLQERSNKTKVKCLLIGVAVLFVAGVLTAPSYAKVDPQTIVGMWLLDDGNGNTAKDSSGNNNNGTLTNGPKWVDGKFGKALSFDGVDDYVAVPNSPSLNITESITIAAWGKYNDVDARQYVVSKGAAYLIEENSTKFLCDMFGCSKWLNSGWATTVLSKNVWYHVAATYNGSLISIYVNGVIESSNAAKCSSLGTTGNILAIGSDVDGSSFDTDGTIDEVVIFNTALSEDDIKLIATWGIEVTLSGNAVDPSDKLTTTWAAIKTQ